MIDEQEASVVRFIFDAYLEGASIKQILVLLKERSILSPTGKPSWCIRTLYELISKPSIFDLLQTHPFTPPY